MKKAIMKVMKDDVVVEEIVGGFKSADENETVLVLEGGAEAHFPKDDDHWLEMTEEVWVLPKRTVKAEGTEPKVKKEKKADAEELKPLKEGGALAVCVGVCRANPTMSRKELIVKIMEALPGKSEGFASTYHNMAMKRIKAEAEAAAKAE